MPDHAARDRTLEHALGAVEGVLGAVVVDGGTADAPPEVQIFVAPGTLSDALREELLEVVRAALPGPVAISTFEVAGAPPAGVPAAEPGSLPDRYPGRLRVVSVVLESSPVTGRHEARVALASDATTAGRAPVGHDPLWAVVDATCDALARRGGGERAVPTAIERVRIGGLEVLLVVVRMHGRPLVGSALVDDEPDHTVAVRATLDALNRWYSDA